MKIDFNEQFKIRIKESDISQAKHLVVKSLICLLIKIKHKNKIIIQTEKNLGKKIICDVYQEFPNGDKVAYEVQKQNSPKWIKETCTKYSNLNIDLVIVYLKEFSDDINKLIKELDKFVV